MLNKMSEISIHAKLQNISEKKYRDLNNWRDIPHIYIERVNIVKLSVLLKLSYGFKVIVIIIAAEFLIKIDMLNLQFVWKFKDLKKQNQS